MSASFFWKTVSSQPLTFCGPEPCLVPINSISCEELILNYEFLGSCCSLVDIPATGGCRVEVAGKGNCAWVPFCEPCDPNSESSCGREFRTDNSDPCPVLTYDALAIQRAWDQNITLPEGSSAAPSVYFPPPQTCPPTTAPGPPTLQPAPVPSGGTSVKMLASVGAVVAATLFATLF